MTKSVPNNVIGEYIKEVSRRKAGSKARQLSTVSAQTTL